MSGRQAFFLPAGAGRSGQRFCIFYPAEGDTVRGSVLYIHPFAEEMNKSRRMAALQARALSRAGFAVLQIDLLGCGDSSGDLGDATWSEWTSDVVEACQWLRLNVSAPLRDSTAPALWLWGLRAGCLLAVEAAARLDGPSNFLFWQPAVSGKVLLQQFMRLKVAGDMAGGHAKSIMEAMRQQLGSGAPVEIAGYTVSAALASGLEQASLQPLPGTHEPRRLEWFELSTREDAGVAPASAAAIAKWQLGCTQVRSHMVHGSGFWQTAEIEEVPALIAATTEALMA